MNILNLFGTKKEKKEEDQDMYTTFELKNNIFKINERHSKYTFNKSIQELNRFAKAENIRFDEIWVKIVGTWNWVDDDDEVLKVIKSLMSNYRFRDFDVSKLNNGIGSLSVRNIFEQGYNFYAPTSPSYKPHFMEVHADNLFFSYRWNHFLNKEIPRSKIINLLS